MVTSQPEMEANPLGAVISRLQQDGRTGLLMVRRENGVEAEEGIIALIKGQVTGLEAGQHKGQEAFNAMSQWRDCYFSFMSPDQPGNAPLLSGEPPDMPSTMPAPPSAPPLEDIPTLPLVSRDLSPVDQAQDFAQSTTSLHGIPVQVMPFETARLVLDRMGSRIYRRVYLLIDGRRSTAELIRLARRSPAEMDQILYDLIQAGLIRVQ